MTRALQEAGGRTELLVEIDLKRGDDQDMTSDQPYSTLLRAALGNQINCLVAGPNCRTRAVLRHIPLSPTYHGPRPSRRWDEEEVGREEKRKVEDDDLMLWRAIFIYVVAKHVRKAEEGREAKEKREVRMMIEQPASPQNHPEDGGDVWSLHSDLQPRRLGRGWGTSQTNNH